MDDLMNLNQAKINKIKLLSELVWENRIKDANIRNWLIGISHVQELSEETLESLLCALGNFMYFSDRLIREMLRALFRDIYKKNIFDNIRDSIPECFDRLIIEAKIKETLQATKFLGVGNPSESGPHMLYLFRQENKLRIDNFIGMDEVFHYEKHGSDWHITLKDTNITHYIFIDDFCGSGTQAKRRLKSYVDSLKSLNPHCQCCYYSLVGTLDGLDDVRANTSLDSVEAVIELDNSFKIFSDESKILFDEDGVDRKQDFRQVCEMFSTYFNISDPYGFSDGQQLLGFHHNTPNNTIPVFWWNDNRFLTPIFKRYQKL